ncbi:TspO/MBR family protein [Ancylostoma duodenale]|uniref:TspO/MBR family protein n=1 Tax=Ancylostoma duodenale TaxID=51022 RepID=A0A0C2FY45_9BILA|nr:TspO/MBR family protein [Ancylostoma duodenale]
MVPAGAAGAAFAVFARDKEVVDWWTIEYDYCYNLVEKLPCTTFRVFDEGFDANPLVSESCDAYGPVYGFDYTDTRLALGLYGANMALALTTIPLVKKKNLGCLWKNTALVHLTAAGAAFAFYKIDKTAGLWMIPYALWTGFYAILTYSIDKENRVIKDI